MSGPDGEEQLQQRIQDLFETDEEDDDIFEPATDASVETDDLEDATGTDEYTGRLTRSIVGAVLKQYRCQRGARRYRDCL